MTIWDGLAQFNPSEDQIIANKKIGRIYVSDFPSGEGKYVSSVLNDGADPYDISIKISPKIEIRITILVTMKKSKE